MNAISPQARHVFFGEIWFGRPPFSSSRFYTNFTFTISPWQGRPQGFEGGGFCEWREKKISDSNLLHTRDDKKHNIA